MGLRKAAAVKRRGFTLVEMLVTVSIIALLMTIAIAAYVRVSKSAQERQTRATFEILKLMAGNFQDAGASLKFTPAYDGPIDCPGGVIEQGLDRFGAAVMNTNDVMTQMRSLPRNGKVVESVGQDKLLKDSVGTYSFVMLDAWHNPIIYVPKGGLGTDPGGGGKPVMIGGQNYRVTSTGKIAPNAVTLPEARAFWASAGPDGDFSKGDDNLYSFEN